MRKFNFQLLRRILLCTATIAVLGTACLFATGYTKSPLMLRVLSTIPGLREVVENQLVGDAGIKEALMNGYGDFVNSSVNKDGVRLTLEHVVADQWRLATIFKIDLDESIYAYINSYHVSIYDSDGNQPQCERCSNLRRCWDPEHQKVLTTREIATYEKVSKLKSGHYMLRCKVSAVTMDSEQVELTLEAPFELNAKMVAAQPLVYRPRPAQISIDKAQVEVIKVEAHPTITVVHLRYNLPDDYQFLNWPNLKLIGGKGKDYPGLNWSWHGTASTSENYFASIYFDKPKTLTLEGNGIEVMKREDRFRRISISENSQTVSIMGTEVTFESVTFDQKGVLHLCGRYRIADWDYLVFRVVGDQYGSKPTCFMGPEFSPGRKVQDLEAQAHGLNTASSYVELEFTVYGHVYGSPWQTKLTR